MVGGFRITPDGTQVVYAAEQDTPDTSELYVRPVDASAGPVKLSGALPNGRDAFIDALTPDGTRLVFLANRDAQDVNEAFSVPIDASSGPVKLNGAVVSGGEVIGGTISFDGDLYIYFADQDTAGVVEIFSVPVDGAEMDTKLNGPLLGAFAISEDSEFVVYLEGSFFGATGLFSVPAAGGVASPLNDPLVPGGMIEGLAEIAADSRTVVYRAEQDALGVVELYRVSIPEPGSALLVALALLSLVTRGRRSA